MLYTVEVQSDHLQRLTAAMPLTALAELIWNSLDADATRVDVRFERGALGLERIQVRDNGHGIPHDEAEALFRNLGGSWKKETLKSKTEKRDLHGSEGRGRFKAFSLGRAVTWSVNYAEGDLVRQYEITILEDDLRQVRIGDEPIELESASPGVTVTVADLHKNFESLAEGPALQELTEQLAIYLTKYRHVEVRVDGRRLKPESAIAHRVHYALAPIIDRDGNEHACELEIIEWNAATERCLYLCSEEGFPFGKVPRRFHVGDFQFSAYLKSRFVSEASDANLIEIAELTPELSAAADNAKEKISEHFRTRAAEKASQLVEEWKAEEIYPYKGAADSHVEAAERQVFDIVAVTASEYMPGFRWAPRPQKALHLRMLRSAIARSPQDLQLILQEVLDLPARQRAKLARLLEETSLSAIISAAQEVADRLKFISGLEQILFDDQMKKRLKERSQLHKIVARVAWIFGEEYNLSQSDKGLTALLRKHREILKDPVVIGDEPVKHPTKKAGILDLVLTTSLCRHRPDEIEHLVVELKRPSVKIGVDALDQITNYARAVTDDPRFRIPGVRWKFWAISDDVHEDVKFRMPEHEEPGVVIRKSNMLIGVKPWGEIIEENKARLQFFQERLEVEVDEGNALKFLRQKYAEFLEGVTGDDDEEE